MKICPVSIPKRIKMHLEERLPASLTNQDTGYQLHHTIHAKQHLTGITDNNHIATMTNRIAPMTELLHH